MPVLARSALERRGYEASVRLGSRFLMAASGVSGALLAWFLLDDPIVCVAFTIACACMGALLVCDLQHRILPTEFVILLVALATVFRCTASGWLDVVYLGVPAILVSMMLLAINSFRMHMGREELIGAGDIRMIAPLTLFSGSQGVLPGLFAASLLMGMLALILLALKHAKKDAPIALAPGLAVWMFVGTLIPFA